MAVDISKPHIEAEIDDEGGVTLTVKGASGPACLAMTKDLEESLNGTVHTPELLPEYAEVRQEQHVQAGTQ